MTVSLAASLFDFSVQGRLLCIQFFLYTYFHINFTILHYHTYKGN